jgi:hypothetical protein
MIMAEKFPFTSKLYSRQCLHTALVLQTKQLHKAFNRQCLHNAFNRQCLHKAFKRQFMHNAFNRQWKLLHTLLLSLPPSVGNPYCCSVQEEQQTHLFTLPPSVGNPYCGSVQEEQQTHSVSLTSISL